MAGSPGVHFISRVTTEVGIFVPSSFTGASQAEPAALERILYEFIPGEGEWGKREETT